MKLLFILFTFITLLNARVITFSPLSMDKSPKLFLSYKPLLKYLEKETGYKFKYYFSPTYKDLLIDFQHKKIDIVELGPLPFLKLYSQYKHAKPFLTFKSKNYRPYYTCNMVTTDKSINTLNDVVSNKVQIELTRKLSTCGYLMSEYILNTQNKTLKDFNYKYNGTHSSVLLQTLFNHNSVGIAKSTIIDKYKPFKFKIIKKSPDIPGFAFVANTNTLTTEEIRNIQNAIIKLNPEYNKKHRKLMKEWSSNTKYGAIKTKKDAYSLILKTMDEIKIPKGIK